MSGESGAASNSEDAYERQCRVDATETTDGGARVLLLLCSILAVSSIRTRETDHDDRARRVSDEAGGDTTHGDP